MTSRGVFITGTDTNVGKTWSSIALMHGLQRLGVTVLGMKPVAAGCDWLDGSWKNADALLLQQHASRQVDYALINPYAFEPALSPHIACDGRVVDLQGIVKIYRQLAGQTDLVVVEGAGGWYSPLDRRIANVDLALALRLPVLLVVGMRLGCINQALLSWRALQLSGLPGAGWLAVELEPAMAGLAANLSYLQAAIDAPLLGVLPYQSSPDFARLGNSVDYGEICTVLDLDQNSSWAK